MIGMGVTTLKRLVDGSIVPTCLELYPIFSKKAMEPSTMSQVPGKY